jgi:hypothetical protein
MEQPRPRPKQNKKKVKQTPSNSTATPGRARNAPAPPRRPQQKKLTKHERKEKEECCVDPALERWCRLQADPFNAPYNGVYWPINKDGFPCQRSLMRGTASWDITVGATFTDMVAWFFPTGYWDGYNLSWRPVTYVGGITRMLGPACNTIVGGGGLVTQTESICFAAGQTATFAALDTMQVTPGGAAAQWYYYESNPEFLYPEIQNGPGAMNGRTIAYAVRVSFVGALSNTRGYVEFVQPTEYPAGLNGATNGTLSSNRRGPAYRKHFFSDERTFTYVWEPICDEIDDSPILGTSTPTVSPLTSRLALHVGGVVAGDIITIDVITMQEFSGKTVAGSSIPTTQSKDAVHLANTIVREYGAVNSGSGPDGRETPGKSLLGGITLDKIAHTAGDVFRTIERGASIVTNLASLGI